MTTSTITSQPVTEGAWTYAPVDTWTWTATNGDTVITGSGIVDLRRKVYDHTRTARTGVSYSVASTGPGRALCARRYTQNYLRTV